MTYPEKKEWLLAALDAEIESYSILIKIAIDHKASIKSYDPEDPVAQVKMNAFGRHLRQFNTSAALNKGWEKYMGC